MNHIFLVILLCLAVANAQKHKKQLIDKDWKMVIVSGPNEAKRLLNKEFDITVPSTIHLNLEQHKEIPDPFFGDNIKQLMWISACSVNFQTNFKVTEDKLKYSRARLIFEGIDTYADVFLNGEKLGSTKNAFLKYEYEVHKILKVGNNNLTVTIKSTKTADAEGQNKNRMPFQYAHTRKACYQYSWDWAPYMNTMGIWLPVHLNFYDEIKLDYVWIRNQELTENKAKLDIVTVLDCDLNTPVQQKNITLKIRRTDDGSEKIVRLFSKHSNTDLNINRPQLWWPNNIGDPHVYEFQFFLYKSGVQVDFKRVVYGIKTIRLNQDGTNFKIIINGYAIYCKGANYVPPDMMYPRLINDKFNAKNTIASLLQDAVDSNFNMLRVWGGGQYESDEFYEMASRKGLMIFQDFMFSDSIYPATDDFLENVKNEVVYQVRRLRNFPCIVLWSGNNEILQGIHSWGWGQPNYVQNYEKVFKQLIPNILNTQNGYIPYIDSSPSRGVGNAGFHNGGDIHYWGVWAAGSPFQSYETALGGFNSEFGTQSLPVWESIKQFVNQQDQSFTSEAFLSHERHNSKFRTLDNYMKRYSKAPLNFELAAYVSGLVQAHGIEIAIRAQRIAKPTSYGTLYWQFNDAWPSISWSSIDYYGRWKALQYQAKNLYSDIIFFYHPKTRLATAINDKLYAVDAYYLLEVMDFNGKILFRDQGLINLKEDERRGILTVPEGNIKGVQKKILIYTEILYGGHPENRTWVTAYHSPPKDLELQEAELTVKHIYDSNEIEFSSSKLIKNLMIGNSRLFLKYSNNYFDVVPGHPVRVKVLHEQPLQQLKPSMTYQSYMQTYDPAPLRVLTLN